MIVKLMGYGADRDHAWRPVRESVVTTRSASYIAALDRQFPHPTREGASARESAIIDVSRPQRSRSRKALSSLADLALAVLLVLGIPLVIIAISLPLLWLVRTAAGLVGLF